MRQDGTPVSFLLERVRDWAGIQVDSSGPVPMIRLKNHVIARFPDSESCESVLFGHLRKEVHDDPDELPEGVCPTEDYERLLVDLRAPGGMETAVRALMSAYIAAKSSGERDWWLKPENIKSDPKGEKVVKTLRRYRERSTAES